MVKLILKVYFVHLFKWDSFQSKWVWASAVNWWTPPGTRRSPTIRCCGVGEGCSDGVKRGSGRFLHGSQRSQKEREAWKWDEVVQKVGESQHTHTHTDKLHTHKGAAGVGSMPLGHSVRGAPLCPPPTLEDNGGNQQTRGKGRRHIQMWKDALCFVRTDVCACWVAHNAVSDLQRSVAAERGVKVKSREQWWKATELQKIATPVINCGGRREA